MMDALHYMAKKLSRMPGGEVRCIIQEPPIGLVDCSQDFLCSVTGQDYFVGIRRA